MDYGAKNLVYEGIDGARALSTAVYKSNRARQTRSVVTDSWGFCESRCRAAVFTLDNNIFAEAEAQGQAWFAAFG